MYLNRVTEFNECYYIASNLIFDIGKVCLCPTNSVSADKDPCPEGE